ncbi:MAG: sulfatase [Burkholderiaceae bacterium]
MRVIFVLYDSLVRGAMQCYGGEHIDTPNFLRFAERAVTFDTHFVGSLPCMPARRDMHTGRLNFLHRSWGALEPFDQSFSELLRAAGTYTHLVSDHYHYWEDGGATYHNRYSSWEFIRGQEWDKWKAMVQPPLERFRQMYHAMQQPAGPNDGRIQSMVNRESMKDEADFCCPRTFTSGFEFLDRNRDADNWLLQLECFDPHEPFHAPARFREKYPSGYTGPILDWPRYKRNEENAAEVAELRANYAALLSMCDEYFGRLLDYLDAHDMWKDTAVVLTTDHGFLLAEHDWWGKNRMPFFNEIAHIPLLMHVPGQEAMAGQRRHSLTHTTDIMPTLRPVRPHAADHCRGPLAAAATGRGSPGARGRALRHVRRRYQHHRRPLHLFPLPGGHEPAGTVRVHLDAGAPEVSVPARGTAQSDPGERLRLHAGRAAAAGAGAAQRQGAAGRPRWTGRRLRGHHHRALRPRERPGSIAAVSG